MKTRVLVPGRQCRAARHFPLYQRLAPSLRGCLPFPLLSLTPQQTTLWLKINQEVRLLQKVWKVWP